MKDAAEYIGIGILILCTCFGCSYCRLTDAKVELMEEQTKQLREKVKP